jgi:hypothetical protein
MKYATSLFNSVAFVKVNLKLVFFLLPFISPQCCLREDVNTFLHMVLVALNYRQGEL